MMTLQNANDLVAPILESDIFQVNPDLQKKADEIKALFVGFEYKSVFKSPWSEILDDDKEAAFKELIAMYEAELLKLRAAQVLSGN